MSHSLALSLSECVPVGVWMLAVSPHSVLCLDTLSLLLCLVRSVRADGGGGASAVSTLSAVMRCPWH